MTRVHHIPSRAVVLVIDHDPAEREALGLILEATYDVLFAEDGPSAIKLLRTQRPDVVLLDLGLPSMSGFDVLAAIEAIAPELPVVVVTITTTTGAVVRAVKLGAFDYVTKPFQDDEVLAKIAAALTGERTQRNTGAWEPQDGARADPKNRRCLVLAGHLGTAGTLKLILERYVATDVVADGIAAVRVLGAAVPDCVVCDEAGWAAEGAAFVRVLRSQRPRCRVVLFIANGDGKGHQRDWGMLVDALVPQGAGLAEVVRRILSLCALDVASHSRTYLNRHVMTAMDYLRVRYAEAVTAEAVARAACISRSRLTELFQAEVGSSLSQYLVTLRVEIAKLLLGHGLAKLDEVASQAGFCDSSHFSRVFRIQTGRRPGAYRREFAIR